MEQPLLAQIREPRPIRIPYIHRQSSRPDLGLQYGGSHRVRLRFPSPRTLPLPQHYVSASRRYSQSEALHFGLVRTDPAKIHTVDLVVPLVWAPTYYFFSSISQAEHPLKETILNLVSSLVGVLNTSPFSRGHSNTTNPGFLHPLG